MAACLISRVILPQWQIHILSGMMIRNVYPDVLVQLLLGKGGAGLRGERGEEKGWVQGGEERRVRTRAQTPLSNPEVHGKGGHTRHRRCHRGVWEKPRDERRQLATSTLTTADLHNTARGNPTWENNGHM